MLNSKPQRGRPKGSGIDDRAILLDVARRMHADPQLKATTAIKATGISDPSVIRRLRDKFRNVEAELRLELSAWAANEYRKPAAQQTMQPCAKAYVKVACAHVTHMDAISEPMTKRATAQPQPVARAHSVSLSYSRDHEPELHEGLVAWFSMGLSAFNAALQMQQLAMHQLMKLPQVAVMMRQQIVVNEMAMALCTPKRTGRFSLH